MDADPMNGEPRALDVNPDTVCFLVDKAHEFHAKEGVVIEDEPLSPADDWARQVLADHNDDPTYHELRATINDLEPDQQVQLVALMWLGRGDFDETEWDQAIEAAGEAWNTRTAEYLIATPMLADYLQEGLSLLGFSCAD
jgi:hypothetical protein